MVSTFYTPRQLSAEEVNPMSNLIGRALDTYSKGMQASYLPRRLEADLFSKEISPLAALASNPNFTGFNPNIQKLIAARIGGYLSGMPSQGLLQEDVSTPGYASDEDIYSRLSEGSKESFGPGAKSALMKSRFASLAEQLGLPAEISKSLGGTEVAGQQSAFEQAKIEAQRRLVMKGYSPQEAAAAVQEMPNEPAEAYKKRIQSLFVPKIDRAKNKASTKKTMDMYRDGEHYLIPEDRVYEALQEGFSYAPR